MLDIGLTEFIATIGSECILNIASARSYSFYKV